MHLHGMTQSFLPQRRLDCAASPRGESIGRFAQTNALPEIHPTPRHHPAVSSITSPRRTWKDDVIRQKAWQSPHSARQSKEPKAVLDTPKGQPAKDIKTEQKRRRTMRLARSAQVPQQQETPQAEEKREDPREKARRALAKFRDFGHMAVSIQRWKKKQKEAAMKDSSSGLTAAETKRMDILHSAYEKYRDDGELHRDDIAKALECIGHAYPKADWIATSYSGITSYTTITKIEFIKFVSEYEQRQHEAYQQAFKETDDNGNGRIDAEELAALLKSLHIEPMRHVLQEVFEEVNEDGGGNLDFAEFEQLMHMIHSRGGFTRKENDKFLKVFHRFDMDSSGEVDTAELCAILTWLGFKCAYDEVIKIMKEVDFDRSGTIDVKEFVMCMRKVREMEIAALKTVIADNDTDGSGEVSGYKELSHVIEALGYLPDADAIPDAAADMQISLDNDDLDLSQVWQVLTVYRSREGFSKSVVTELAEIFNKYDRLNDSDGQIDCIEVGQVFRSIGQPLEYEEQQKLVDIVDVDGSGMLDLGEVLKMYRMHEAVAVESADEAFRKQERKGEQNGTIGVEECIAALDRLGYIDVTEESPELENAWLMDEDDFPYFDAAAFRRAVLKLRSSTRKQVLENCGFSATSVKQLKGDFEKFDEDHSGEISRRELVKLVEQTFPSLAHDLDMRPRLIQMLQDVDSDGSGGMDFHDYLRLMGRALDMQDRARLSKLQRVAEDTKFSREEVKEFRELFCFADKNKDNFLSKREAAKMINDVCPLNDDEIAEFGTIFKRIVSVNSTNKELDFPDFLYLMYELMKVDFARLKTRTSIIANRGMGTRSLGRQLSCASSAFSRSNSTS